jgi:uncharacterized membrane protein YgcG
MRWVVPAMAIMLSLSVAQAEEMAAPNQRPESPAAPATAPPPSPSATASLDSVLPEPSPPGAIPEVKVAEYQEKLPAPRIIEPTTVPPTGHTDAAYAVPSPTADDVFASKMICPFPARWSVRHDVGDGVGYTRGFTYLEGFCPLWRPKESALVFGDARVVNFDDADRWEFNAGAGYRVHVPSSDTVLGLNCFYDGRHTDTNFFHQIGVGAEAIFARWEARANGYLVVGPHERLAGDSGEFTVPMGDQLLIARILTHDVAMSGADVEGGVMLPAIGCVAPRVFVGLYHYSGEGLHPANGVRARLEAWVSRNVTVHCSVQHDGLFDTTVYGGLAIHFGGADVSRNAGCDPPRGIEERLGQRVVRDVNIVVAQSHALSGRLITPTQPDGPPTNDPPTAGGTGGGGGTGGSGGTGGTGGTGGGSGGSSGGTGGTGGPGGSGGDSGDSPCLPFPGRPGDPATFPGHKFPPGFHHDCFPGRGRYKHVDDDK